MALDLPGYGVTDPGLQSCFIEVKSWSMCISRRAGVAEVDGAYERPCQLKFMRCHLEGQRFAPARTVSQACLNDFLGILMGCHSLPLNAP